MSEWKTISTEDFCESVRDGTHDSPKQTKEGRPLVTSRHIIGDQLDLDNAYLISHKDFDEINKRSKVDRWDVLISMIGTVGEVYLVQEEAVFAIKNIGLFKTKSELDGRWLYQFLRSPLCQQEIRERSRGTTQQYIPLGELRSLPIDVPGSQEEQATIVEILSSLDEKIELNRKQNRTLEAIAQALFKRWFVEFEFPDQNGQPYKSSGGAIQPSELGEIPVGWQVDKLEELIGELETGSRPKGGVGQFTEGVTSIGAESITRIGEYDYGKTKFVPEEYFAKMRRGTIKDRDVLIYKDGGTPGRFDARISMFGSGFPYETACLNEHVFRLQAKKPIYQNYLYLWFSSYLIIEELRFRGAKAAIPGINSTDVKDLDFLFMDEKILEQFDEVIEPLFSKLLHNSREMAVLGKLRDALLPKLMSGELRVA